MPVEQRGQVTRADLGQRATGGTQRIGGRRTPSLGGTSRISREAYVRICEGLGVRFPGPTRLRAPGEAGASRWVTWPPRGGQEVPPATERATRSLGPGLASGRVTVPDEA